MSNEYQLARIMMPSFQELNRVTFENDKLSANTIGRDRLFRRMYEREGRDDEVESFVISNENEMYAVIYDSEEQKHTKISSLLYGIKNDTNNYELLDETFEQFQKNYKNSEFYERFKDEILKEHLSGDYNNIGLEDELFNDTRSIALTIRNGEKELKMLRINDFISPSFRVFLPVKDNNSVEWKEISYGAFIYRQTTYANGTMFAALPENSCIIAECADSFLDPEGTVKVYINGDKAFEVTNKESLSNDRLMQIASVATPIEQFHPWDLNDHDIEITMEIVA